MKNVFLSIFILLSLGSLCSCDDGKIYEDTTPTEIEGGKVKLTAKLIGFETWPSGSYSISLAAFTSDNEFAKSAKTIVPEKDGWVETVLTGISSSVDQIEVCVINKLRRRIVSFYSVDFAEQPDTIFLDVGDLNVSMFEGIQRNVFNTDCVGCHGASTTAAGGLFLTEETSYASLVNVAADLSPEGKPLVKPGEPDESFIMDVLLSDGVIRHDHKDILSGKAEKISLLRSWISNGARK